MIKKINILVVLLWLVAFGLVSFPTHSGEEAMINWHDHVVFHLNSFFVKELGHLNNEIANTVITSERMGLLYMKVIAPVFALIILVLNFAFYIVRPKFEKLIARVVG